MASFFTFLPHVLSLEQDYEKHSQSHSVRMFPAKTGLNSQFLRHPEMSSPAPEFEKMFLNMMDAGALYAEKTIFWGANDLFSPILSSEPKCVFCSG